MAQNIQPSLGQEVATPQHYVAPGARELRVQAVHRLQVGFFGLAAMLLLVGLANIIMDRARLADEGTSAAETAINSFTKFQTDGTQRLQHAANLLLQRACR